MNLTFDSWLKFAIFGLDGALTFVGSEIVVEFDFV